ncbi:MAG TPA: transcription elongation factor GreA [Bacillota bacterium]|jgi:transcription elongation factor GreA
MADKEVILSLEGLKKLEQELEHLKSVRRREVAERIKQARQFGDVGENSEYEDAKNEQAFIEGRILTLEKLLRNAKLMDEVSVEAGRVGVGSKVKLKEFKKGVVVEFTIVGSTEADPGRNLISNESPVGKAMLGQKVGTVVEVNIPAGTIKYEILGISR